MNKFLLRKPVSGTPSKILQPDLWNPSSYLSSLENNLHQIVFQNTTTSQHCCFWMNSADRLRRSTRIWKKYFTNPAMWPFLRGKSFLRQKKTNSFTILLATPKRPDLRSPAVVVATPRTENKAKPAKATKLTWEVKLSNGTATQPSRLNMNQPMSHLGWVFHRDVLKLHGFMKESLRIPK